MSEGVPGRRNGFTPPYNMPQICAWLALVGSFLHFILGITPILPLKASIPLTAFFIFLVGLVLLYGTRATAIDSMDAFLEQHLRAARGGHVCRETKFSDRLYNAYNKPRENVQPLPADKMKQCWICDVQVCETSMHCKYCNKCVGNFDHHCLWLNTCVGERNYEDFFRVMLAIFAMQVFHLSTSLALCIDIFLDGLTAERAESWWGETIMSVLLLAFMAFDAFSLALLVQLVWFHLGLQREQITTYQYIIRDHQKRRERNKLQRELDHQRTTALAKAEREGRSFQRCRLLWGEESRKLGCGDTCDPLNMPSEVNDDAGFATSLGGGGGGHAANASTSDVDDEEAQPSHDDDDDEGADDDAPPQEQALPSSHDETPGVQFLRVRDGDDIMAEPGAFNGDEEAAQDEDQGPGDSQPWEIPSADDSRLEQQNSGENIPKADAHVSEHEDGAEATTKAPVDAQDKSAAGTENETDKQ